MPLRSASTSTSTNVRRRSRLVESAFSLADITDTEPFRRLGRALATDPDGQLSRTLLSARVVRDPDGIRRTELVTTTAADRVRSTVPLLPAEHLRAQLADMVLASPWVQARKEERAAVAPLLEAFFDGLGNKAVEVLSVNLDRAGTRLLQLVAREQRRFAVKPSYHQVVEVKTFDPPRPTDRDLSTDRFGTFSRSMAYDDWKRCAYPLAWFDTRPERTVANMVDEDEAVRFWVRLHIRDLPILWSDAGRWYNPDLIVVETDGTHWLVEVKADKNMNSPEVQGKRGRQAVGQPRLRRRHGRHPLALCPLQRERHRDSEGVVAGPQEARRLGMQERAHLQEWLSATPRPLATTCWSSPLSTTGGKAPAVRWLATASTCWRWSPLGDWSSPNSNEKKTGASTSRRSPT